MIPVAPITTGLLLLLSLLLLLTSLSLQQWTSVDVSVSCFVPRGRELV